MSTRTRSWVLCALACALALAVRYPAANGAQPPKVQPSEGPSTQGRGTQESVAPGGVESLVQRGGKVEPVDYPWGWIRWTYNAKADPNAEMTFGMVHVKAHQENPAHIHPNCAELLHVLCGSCEHALGRQWVTLKQGDTIRIPAGVPHRAKTGDQPLRAVIVYSSGNRQFLPVDDKATE